MIAASKYTCSPPAMVCTRLMVVASRMPSEIGTSMLRRPEASAVRAERKNGCAGVEDRGERDERRQPVEQRLHGGVHVAREPRPHRDRQQHDVGRGKAGDGEAPQEVGAVRAALLVAEVRGFGSVKAGALEHACQRVAVGAAWVEAHGDALRR